MTTVTPRLCECGHRILEHELVDHGAVSEYTRIMVREKCTLCPCPKWKMNGYTEKLPDYGDLMTVKDFREACESGAFIDYDGSGHPVKDGKMMRTLDVIPSKLGRIPEDATHIMWFNR